jgi:creatinine amidohydrolase/Fe(II)-dependent formamide hydrolase-like protein
MSLESCPLAWLPQDVNRGVWLTHYTLDELEQRLDGERVVLPVCSLATPVEELEQLGPLVLPPLFREALEPDPQTALVARIRYCFPYYHGTQRRGKAHTTLEVVELPPAAPAEVDRRPRILAFSVDTAVEEHGPHLPLATDRIQSYGVLVRLAAEIAEVALAPPVDYGHLTWGLPRGLSIDVTPKLLTEYVAQYARAVVERYRPDALYVVDVHGSPVHRQAIQDGLAASGVPCWKFRWLYEPLVEFASERGDQHAGGVETAVIEAIGPGLVDPFWWPGRERELAAGEMSFELALQLQTDLAAFIEYAESNPWNGIVGRIDNYHSLDGRMLLDRMVDLAREDVRVLLSGP